MAEQGKSPWTALIGAIAGALISGASLAFFFGGEMRQITLNRQSIIELRNLTTGGVDAVQRSQLDAINKDIDGIQQQLTNGRNALIAQNARLGVLEARVEDLRREVEINRKRLP